MKKLAFLVRLVAGYWLGLLGTLIVFGLALAALWAIGPEGKTLKLGSAILSAILAMGAGGFLVAWAVTRDEMVLAGAFGFLFGGFSFSYLLGLGWTALILAGASAAIAALAALGYRSAFHKPVGPTGMDAR